jgi:uncharacterized protein (DUF58 family)
MKNRLLAFSLLFAVVAGIALIGLSGAILAVGAPLLLYILASWLWRPQPEVSATRVLGATRVVPGTPVAVTVTVANKGQELREVVVWDEVPAGLAIMDGEARASTTLAAGEEFSWTYSVGGERGTFEFAPITVEVAGDFPLRSQRVRFPVPQELVTLPDHRSLSRIPVAPRRMLVYSGTLPSRTGGEGTEFFDVRLHDSRGPARHINWRLTARRPGDVYVNEYQEERVADIGIILDARARAYPARRGRSLFEYAASASASLADILLDQGNRVGFLAYGLSLDWTTPGFGRVQKQRVLTRLARVEPGESYVFERLDAIPDRLLPAGSQLVIVSPLGPDDMQAVLRLRMMRYSVLVVSPDPLAYAAVPNPDSAEAAGMRIARAGRRVMLQRLRHAGIPVIDWDTAKPFDATVSAALGRIQAAWRRWAQ